MAVRGEGGVASEEDAVSMEVSKLSRKVTLYFAGKLFFCQGKVLSQVKVLLGGNPRPHRKGLEGNHSH